MKRATVANGGSARTPDQLAGHPVLRSKIRLPTPSIRSAYDVLANTAFQRAPGCSFYGHPRFGKTEGISVLADQLAQSFPGMPIFTVSAAWHARFSEGTFICELLTACKHFMAAVGTVGVRRARLRTFLGMQAQTGHSDIVMLLIDEAQNWHEPELTTLRDLANEIALEHKVLLIGILFGTPELASLRTALIQSGRIDLVGRFMIQQYEFRGVFTPEDLAIIMSFYDDPEVSEYPEGSGNSYSQFLMGQAYASGWRLQQEVENLWGQYKLAAQASGGLNQIGMQWVADSIRRFFMANLEYDHPGFRGEAGTWKVAVAQSGFKDSLGVTYTT
ncbi:MAG: ATP-binding protein [Pseudomonadota bacterium]